jgi:hypothetical protein
MITINPKFIVLDSQKRYSRAKQIVAGEALLGFIDSKENKSESIPEDFADIYRYSGRDYNSVRFYNPES